MLVAALGVVTLSGVSASTALTGSTAASAAPSTTCPAGASLQIPAGGTNAQAQCVISSTGTPVGGIKHVWLIILENKSYDETFTGLNQNSYLWQTLPQQGALLTNYYGTGHFSEDNYISLVSGQSPSYANQDDCSTTANMTNNNSGIINTGTVGTATDTDHTTDGSGTNTNAPTTSGASNGNYGQLLVHGGIDAALGNNGCVYPTDVATLFNQYNAAGVSWKAYAQDLGGAQPVGATTYQTGSTPGVSDTVPGREDGACGYPGTSAADPVTNPTNLVAPGGDVSSFTGAQPANANNNGDPADQYVAKHFPVAGWFTALTGESAGSQSSVSYPAQPALNEPTTAEPDGPGGSPETNCDANHVANLDDPTYGLAHDLTLQSSQVPAFSWITPNNCSDAHDATCQGNNLSGAFNANGTPNYTPAGLPSDDPEATTPTNYTGGLYAADLFLKYYIPMIEQSAAFADGGLIDVTFDEANPPFTIGNSFNNAPAPGDRSTFAAPQDQPTFGSPGTTEPGATSLYGAYGALADAAGENINGQNVNTEPTGPNDPEVTNGSGQQLQPGPGASGFIDRPTGLAGESANLSGSPGTAVEPAAVAAGSSWVTDAKINADDTGRLVSGTDGNGNTIPPDTFVGAVQDTGPLSLASNSSTTTASNNYAKPWAGSFQLLNDSGQPVTLSNGYDGNTTATDITLGAEGATSSVGGVNCPTGSEAATTSGCVTADPLYDPTDFTPGGGDTGTVLISPLIKPGTVSSTYYNHYSALRTMEDLLLTGHTCTEPANADTPLVAGSVCGGLDGQGHLGYAAQAGLATFGPTVFTADRFSVVVAPKGYATVSGSGTAALYCPKHVDLGPGVPVSHPGSGGFGGVPGIAGASGCGSSGGKGGPGGNGTTAAGVGGDGGNGGNGACPPEEWVSGVWMTSLGAATTPNDTPPCNGTGGNGGKGGAGGNGVGTTPGGNGGNGGNGSPGVPGTKGTRGANG
jgi:hypothetical protein